MPVVAGHIDLYLQSFGEVLRRTEREPSWLRQRRERAMERFLALGVPRPRDEEYKYTDLSQLADGTQLFTADPASPAAGATQYAAWRGPELRFQGGTVLLPNSRSLPPGLRIRSLSDALRADPGALAERLAACADSEHHALTALNTAFFTDGALVEADPGATVDEPVHLVFGDGLQARHPRVLILAGRNASLRVVETYAGSGPYWRNAVTEIHTAANARVDHYRAQLESPESSHTGMLQAVQQRDSMLATFSLSFGAALARNDIRTRLGGPGCECSLDGLYAVRDNQLVDHHTAIDHAQPHCHSHQLYKGVLDGRARGVFNGKIFVRRDAQKTDAVQSNQNLLLSDRAEVNTKPQLEIDANDVRCTHGATIGQLDPTAAFYLRSRGIGEAEARNLLTYAFAADALARIKVQPVREHFEALLLRTFALGSA